MGLMLFFTGLTFGFVGRYRSSHPCTILQVRCWEILRNGASVASTPKASIAHDQPVRN